MHRRRSHIRRAEFSCFCATLQVLIFNHHCCAQECGISQYTVKCDSATVWDESGWKRCIPKYCAVPTEFPNGKITPDSSRIFLGDSLQLECDDGYVLSGLGTSSPKCLDNCSLEQYQVCERISCAPMPDPQGSGALMNDTVYFGDAVTVQCNENYRSSESDTVFNHACDLSYTRTCAGDGSFSPREARCIPVSCPPYDPADQSLQCLDATCGPAYGTVVGQVDSSEPTELGATVSISCHEGYRLRGETSNKPQCSGNCQYTTGHQACTPRLCPDPAVPANARVEAASVPFASSTRITCQGGFVVKGSTPTQCNRSVEITCRLTSNSSTSDIALEPLVAADLCVPAPCPAFALPENAASMSPDGSTSPIHGQEITVTCMEGFRVGAVLDGLAACDAEASYISQCLGCEWQQLDRPVNNPLACLPIACSPPGDVLNGLATPNTSVALGESAVVTCDEGFRVNSNSRNAPRASNVTCLPACNYSVQPSCLVVECTSANAPENGVLVIDGLEVQSSNFESEGIRHNESIIIKCNAGYMIQGSDCLTETHTTCWDGDFTPNHACTPQVCGCGFGLPCEAFKEDANAVQGVNAQANGSLYEVTCKTGFRAASNDQADNAPVACSAPTTYTSRCNDCTYSASMQCAQISCGAYSVANATAASSEAILSAGTVDVTCNLGFRPNSTQSAPLVAGSRMFTATCGGDCVFVPPTQCAPILCTETPEGNHSTSSGAGPLSHQEEVVVTCDEGYYVAGTATCQKVFTVTCFDGALVNKQACSPITTETCGCGVGDCLPYARLAAEDSWEPSGDRAHGQLVTITCAAGYRAGDAGATVAFCTDPETRTATCSDCSYLSTQECLPIACPAFAGSSAVASHSPAGPVSVGNKVTGMCAPGFRYKTTGTKAFTATCGADCSYFLDPTTVCEAIKCPAYTLPANSEVLLDLTSSTRLNHEQIMHLRCLPGYTVNGTDCGTDFNVTCFDGELMASPPDPACVPARCGCGTASCPLWSPANASSVVFVEDEGVWSADSIAHGTQVRLTCKSGFRPAEGDGLAACEAPSRLETRCNDCTMLPDITCRPISCGSLQLTAGEANHSFHPADALGPAGGRVMVDTSVTVACPDGFRLGSRQATQPQQLVAVCQSDCAFSVDTVPACLRVNCPDFTLPSNSRLVNGSGLGWNGVPANGPAGWMGTQLAGAVLNVSCNTGYMMSSSSAPACQQAWQITCSNDGLLSGHSETCKELTCGCGSQGDCPAPTGEAAENVLRVVPAGTLTHGSAFNVTCDEGYRAVDAGSEWSTCEDAAHFGGVCSDCEAALSKRCRAVRCSEYTTDDPNVESWNRPGLDGNDELVTFGQALIVNCKEGHRAGGACAGTSCDSSAPNSFSVACSSQCSFTAGQECKPVACADLPGIPNSDSQTPQPANGMLYGAEVVFTCLPGFMPSGGVQNGDGDECTKELRLQCGADGEWTEAECTPVTCTAPASGAGQGEIVVLGGNYTAKCAEGYDFAGDGGLWGVCGENCLFAPAVKVCEPIRCAPLTEFHTSSPATVTAPPLAVASLTVEYPNSISVTCGEGLVADAALTFTPTLPSCSKDMQLKCDADGTFDLVDPAVPPSLCVAAQCPPFTSVDANALPTEVTSSAISYGTRIRVLCKDGYTPSGSGGNDTFSATCGLRDATGDACLWDTDQTCEPIICGRYSAPARATIQDDQWTPTREYRLGEQVLLRCPVGYVVAGTSCSKDLVELCLPSGQFSGAQCNPIVCPPLSQTPPPLPLPDGASRWPDSVPDTSVTFGTSVQLACPTGSTPFGAPPWVDGREVTCGDSCRLEVGETEACMDTMCPPFTFFDFTSGVEHHPYFDTLGNLSFGENVTVQCMPGFQLDDAMEFTLPGLSDLGSVTVKARRVFASVDRTQDSTFTLDGDYDFISVMVPQGSWPEGLNEPLTVTLFDATDDMQASFAQNGSSLDPQTKIAGGVINFGPEGVTFDPPVRISLPLDRSVDFGSRVLKVHRYDAASRTWTPKDYPAGMSNSVDYATGVVWAETSSFSPYAALALNTRATTTAPAVLATVGITPPLTTPANRSNTTAATNEVTEPPAPPATPAPTSTSSPVPTPEDQGGSDLNIPAIVGGCIGGLALLLCCIAGVYVQETRKRQESGKENLLSQRTAEGETATNPVSAAMPAAQPSDEANRELSMQINGNGNGDGAQPGLAPPPGMEGMPALFPPPTPAMAFFPGSDQMGGAYAGPPGVAAAASYMSPDKLPWASPDGVSTSQMPLLDHEMSAWQPSSPEDVGQSSLLHALSHVAGHGQRGVEDMDGMSMYSESTLRGTTMEGDPVRGHALEIASELAALIPPGWQLCEGCLQPTKIEWMSCPNCAQPLPHALA